MSNLVPSLVPLDSGLNLQTAKIVAPAGSVLDTLNYEQVDFQGQKRIDGFVRYDGSVSSAVDEYEFIRLTTNYLGAPGDLVGTDDGLLGVVVEIAEPDVVHVVVINENLIPAIGDAFYTIVDGENATTYEVLDIINGAASGVDAQEHYENLLTASEVIRNNVEELPGSVIGLHWFRDRLYAIADVPMISIAGTTPSIFPNDVLSNGADTAKVLDVMTLDNTRVAYLDVMDPTDWLVPDTAITRDGDPMGTVTDGYEPITSAQEVASFYESRSEAQVLEEDGPSGPYDFGWRFVDLGWSVNFENGISLFGSLPSLNQNITGLGVQGPTTVTGNSGMPLILLQKVDIVNKPVQVNGWKSSQTPESYELETDNLIDVDDDTIYADAYIYWDGTTGEVVAPGYTNEPIPQYAATSTVIIELP